MSDRSSPSTVFHHLVSSGIQSGPLVASNAAAVAAKRRRTLLTRRPSWSWPPPRPERGRPSTGLTCALAFALRGNGPEVTSAKMRCASGGPPARVRGRQSWRTSLKRKSVLFVPCKNSKKKIAFNNMKLDFKKKKPHTPLHLVKNKVYSALRCTLS